MGDQEVHRDGKVGINEATLVQVVQSSPLSDTVIRAGTVLDQEVMVQLQKPVECTGGVGEGERERGRERGREGEEGWGRKWMGGGAGGRGRGGGLQRVWQLEVNL